MWNRFDGEENCECECQWEMSANTKNTDQTKIIRMKNKSHGILIFRLRWVLFCMRKRSKITKQHTKKNRVEYGIVVHMSSQKQKQWEKKELTHANAYARSHISQNNLSQWMRKTSNKHIESREKEYRKGKERKKYNQTHFGLLREFSFSFAILNFLKSFLLNIGLHSVLIMIKLLWFFFYIIVVAITCLFSSLRKKLSRITKIQIEILKSLFKFTH